MLETLWVAAAYFIGSIPFGLIFARIFCKTDVQKAGSGNIGATNVTRLCGLPVGIATLIFDAGKGYAAVFLAVHLFPAPAAEPGTAALFITCTGLAVILGHMYSVFLKFRGARR
jgi:Predicted membrane protein